ncbi:MAG TPA: farnesyl diphosphate synthase [Gemmatimonadaceae bacterium]|nr:farnesyl diphosphate synthase [Gemmatimonadaceae bacterium]
MSNPFALDRQRIERRLDEISDLYLSDLPRDVAAAIRYGLKSPGKRLRPLLTLYGYRAAGGESDASLLACAAEVIHAYSLMHDDLPCMDDDDMRRGRPTVHKVYGSRTAILAGVAMIPLSVRVVREAAQTMSLTPSAPTAIAETLLAAAGEMGMIGGQLRDLQGEGSTLTLDALQEVHMAKTGALIVGSVRVGAIAANASAEKLSAIEQYGRDIGLAFQIMDDVLDITSSTSVLGKTSGRDVVLRKSTYPRLLGVEGAQQRARALIADGLDSLASQGMLTQELSQVANFMVTRTS